MAACKAKWLFEHILGTSSRLDNIEWQWLSISEIMFKVLGALLI